MYNSIFLLWMYIKIYGDYLCIYLIFVILVIDRIVMNFDLC